MIWFYRRKHPQKRGFTLIEVMVVVAILGIMASIAYSGYGAFVARERVKGAAESVHALMARAAADVRKLNDTLSLGLTTHGLAVYRTHDCSGTVRYEETMPLGVQIVSKAENGSPTGSHPSWIPGAYQVPGCIVLKADLVLHPMSPGFVELRYTRFNYLALVYKSSHLNFTSIALSPDGGSSWDPIQ